MKIFVSVPYTHEDKNVVTQRVKHAAEYSLQKIREGHCVFSPIALGQNILDNTDYDDGSWDVWQGLCNQYIELCDAVHVLMLPGWDKSVGVKAEILRATLLEKRVVYVKMEE